MTTQRRDLYAILGVSTQASPEEIARAYRALVRRHHPDSRGPIERSQSARSDTILRQVVAAYAVLRDPASRASYDQEQTSTHSNAVPRPTQQKPYDFVPPRQPPIIAGPVRWYPTPGAHR